MARRRHPRPSVPTGEKKKRGDFFSGGKVRVGRGFFRRRTPREKKEGVAGGRIDTPEFATSFCKKI